MTIKERVLASLKTSYAKYGFKKDELSSLTDIISANLKEESTDDEITAAVTNAEGYAKMMQTVYNRGISETNKKYEGYIPKPQEPQTPPATPPVTPPQQGNLTIEQVQQMIAKAAEDRQKEIDAAVAKATAPFLEQQEKTRLNGLLMGHEKLKNIPTMFSGKYSLDKEENLDAVAAQIEADYTAMTQDQVSRGQFVAAPAPSSPQTEADDFVTAMHGYAERHAPQPASK